MTFFKQLLQAHTHTPVHTLFPADENPHTPSDPIPSTLHYVSFLHSVSFLQSHEVSQDTTLYSTQPISEHTPETPTPRIHCVESLATGVASVRADTPHPTAPIDWYHSLTLEGKSALLSLAAMATGYNPLDSLGVRGGVHTPGESSTPADYHTTGPSDTPAEPCTHPPRDDQTEYQASLSEPTTCQGVGMTPLFEPFRTFRNLLILDWDNTLFPTCLRAYYQDSTYAFFEPYLYILLARYHELGRVIILTNSNPEGFRCSQQQFLPDLFFHFPTLEVLYGVRTSADPMDWKVQALQDWSIQPQQGLLLSQLEHVCNVGDQILDHAAVFVWLSQYQAYRGTASYYRTSCAPTLSSIVEQLQSIYRAESACIVQREEYPYPETTEVAAGDRRHHYNFWEVRSDGVYTLQAHLFSRANQEAFVEHYHRRTQTISQWAPHVIQHEEMEVAQFRARYTQASPSTATNPLDVPTTQESEPNLHPSEVESCLPAETNPISASEPYSMTLHDSSHCETHPYEVSPVH